jgi:hypothetical protein
MSKKINITELKQERIRKAFDNGIEIYNPNKKEKEEIIKIINESMDIETKEVNITGEDIIVKILPICSNIFIDVEDKNLLKEIIDEPSFELEESITIIGEIIQEIANTVSKNISYIASLPAEEVAKMLKIEELMTDEEMEQLKKLEEKAKKSGIR